MSKSRLPMTKSKPTDDVMSCCICAEPISTSYGKARATQRGYGFCSFACRSTHKARRSYDSREERLMRLVDVRGPDDCWLFKGAKDQHGYGVLSWPTTGHRQVPRRAHRAMWELCNGIIPDGLMVCHSCDNPPCVNPRHLWLGTQGDNMSDMREKGRGRGPEVRYRNPALWQRQR